MKERLAIFGNSTSFITNILLQSTLNEIQKNFQDKIEMIFFVDTVNYSNRIYWLFKRYYLLAFKNNLKKYLFFSIKRSCIKNNVAFIIPDNNSINDPKFIEKLKKVRPTLGLVLGCPQIMGKNLINVFPMIVNYHNSLLPKYRGVYSTHWSLYHSEKYTGFTFHIINEKIDDGNILIQDRLEVDTSKSVFEIEFIKTELAAAHLNKLFELMIRRDQGRLQNGEKTYFGLKKLNEIRYIEDTRNITSAELIKRLAIFGYLKIQIDGRSYFVKKLYRPKINKKHKYSFFTKDGECFHFMAFSNIIYHFYYRLKEMHKFNKH